MKKIKTIILLIFFSILLFSSQADLLFAANLNDAFGNNLDTMAGQSGYKTDQKNIDPLIGNIISVAISLVGVIFLTLMIYAGYLWMTARGDEAQVTKAKNIITAAVIGLAIVMLAYVISMWVVVEMGDEVLKN